ncbi:MAG: Scr1 family TA system antitoxin-like transcriptional regulator [Streptosporangiaceae bacterium]
MWEQMVEARWHGLVSTGFRSLIDAEREGSEISYYEPVLIPSLFQSADYARLQMSSGLRSDRLEELVALPMERQKLFERDDAPWNFLLIRADGHVFLPADRVSYCLV